MEWSTKRNIFLVTVDSRTDSSTESKVNAAVKQIVAKGNNVITSLKYEHYVHWEEANYQNLTWADELWVLVPETGMQVIKKDDRVQKQVDYMKFRKKPIKYCQLNNKFLEYYQINLFD